MYFVYVIKSQVDGRLYKGLTSNPEMRLQTHNTGKVFSTRPYRPWTLVLIESYPTRIEARAREKFLKSGAGRRYLSGLGL